MEVIMVKIQIDGTFYEVNPDKNLLHTCLALGFDIPYFCFHPALGSVGACRMCAVKKFANADDKKGRIVMSCMEPVTDGLIISTSDPDIKVFRAAVIESLMTNHPHDCPICDEGGECHLQDMTVMSGHNYRRFVFKKRTYSNQYLGPFIHHEMNRCIQCYRCVRFYRDYAGGRDLAVSGSANHVYFGRQTEGALESEFSGNLIEVCPTGVFTDKTLKEHYTRKWDMTYAPSICIQCSAGCNITVGERYGSVRRILSRYNGAVNGYFLCDRGRFGYLSTNSPERIKGIMVRDPQENIQKEISRDGYLSVINSAIIGKKIAGIGSPVASLEANFALEAMVGRENFYHGIDGEKFDLERTAIQILKNSSVHSPSLKEIERSDAVLILGEDPAISAPMIALAVRQASRNRSIRMAAKSGIPSWNDAAVRELAQKIKSPVFIATPLTTSLDDLAELRYNSPTSDIARLGSVISSIIDKIEPLSAGSDKSLNDIAQRIAGVLMDAENPVIITGLQHNDKKVLQAAANITAALHHNGKKPSISIIFPECNSLGLALMEGGSLDNLFEVILQGDVETLIILENDLYKRADKKKVDSIFKKCKNVIVLDSLLNETSKQADILLPSGTFAESTGTIVSSEGRGQRYYRVLPVNGHIKDSWKHISEMIEITGISKDLHWEHFDDIVASFTDSYPFFSKIREIIPGSEFRFFNEKIARQTIRFSGRTAMNANDSVSEPKPPGDDDSPLSFSMEGYKGVPPSDLVSYYWSPGWNSVQATNKYMDEPYGSAKGGNPGVLLFDHKT
ncbi:MAG: NADH-quinone oxidoreductase subunit NuoG [Bacteroidales bacterium]|nr:NADH-quinone oxidoreductase subunit NuoG [Bacteroidales bacterium]